jgi:hypothetical protein
VAAFAIRIPRAWISHLSARVTATADSSVVLPLSELRPVSLNFPAGIIGIQTLGQSCQSPEILSRFSFSAGISTELRENDFD